MRRWYEQRYFPHQLHILRNNTVTQFKQCVAELQHATQQLGDAVGQLQQLTLRSPSTEVCVRAVTYHHTKCIRQASVGAALRRYHDNQNLFARLVDHLAQYGYLDTATKPPVDPLDSLPEATSPPRADEPVHTDAITLMPTPATACSTPKAFHAPTPAVQSAASLPSVEQQPIRPLHALAYKTPAVAARLRDATPASTALSANISLTPGMQYVQCDLLQC